MLFGREDKYSFFIIRLPHLSDNVPSSILYAWFSLELLRTASYNGFILQGGNTKQLKNHAKKMFQNMQTLYQNKT